MIGDTTHDLDLAQKPGRMLAVGYGAHSPEELDPAIAARHPAFGIGTARVAGAPRLNLK